MDLIEISYGGKGQKGDRRDRANIVGIGESLRLVLYPREELLPHMGDWRFARAKWVPNENGEIIGIMLMKAERGGFSVRRREHQRLHLHLPLTDVTINTVDHHDGDDGDGVIGRIEGDGIAFTLPKVIAGSGRYCGGKHFKITRS
jgi:hypothetical protein